MCLLGNLAPLALPPQYSKPCPPPPINLPTPMYVLTHAVVDFLRWFDSMIQDLPGQADRQMNFQAYPLVAFQTESSWMKNPWRLSPPPSEEGTLQNKYILYFRLLFFFCFFFCFFFFLFLFFFVFVFFFGLTAL